MQEVGNRVQNYVCKHNFGIHILNCHNIRIKGCSGLALCSNTVSVTAKSFLLTFGLMKFCSQRFHLYIFDDKC